MDVRCSPDRACELAKAYSDWHLFAPVYRDSDDGKRQVKVKGCASWRDGVRAMKILVDRFSNRPIRSITKNDVKQWKIDRENEPTLHGDVRSNATVHRDSSFLRHALNYAIEEGWLDRNPCSFAGFIDAKMETRRERVITIKEERLLLSATDAFVKSFLMFLLNTGLRIEEAQRLQRGMITLGKGPFGHIDMPARICKFKEARDLPVLTPAVREAIEQRFAIIPNDPIALVFGNRYRDLFDAAKQVTGIENLELRATRHTFVTRASRVFPMGEVMKWTGHHSAPNGALNTHLRYLNPDEEVHDDRFKPYLAAIALLQANRK